MFLWRNYFAALNELLCVFLCLEIIFFNGLASVLRVVVCWQSGVQLQLDTLCTFAAKKYYLTKGVDSSTYAMKF